MTDSQARLQPLQAQLQQELHLTQQFFNLLNEESQVLETGQPDDLNRTTSLKEKIAEDLHAATQRRGSLLEALNLPNNLQGLRAAAAQQPELSALVEELGTLSDRAQRLNEQNGNIINALLTNTQRMMAALQTLTGNNTVYDASGKKKAATVAADIPRLKPLKAG
ncbi:flagellar protein FlgN [Pusillimonas sp. DMV24BSW_D]|uniref:flagella synthesis protein FlgN n=1 Tax=Neopusillimonas aestuarii TaxID=2716226 RepID=UPI00140CD23B|nr:flagellar protein FlgN [Pusillimonas sp. DMV24BSW_D]QIM49233.1 flagellar protein FlgN [Pusillimonas sp. DMV24BSW_D]